MTWAEFKELVEQAGVTDDMQINYIDVDTLRDEPSSPEVLIEDSIFEVFN